MPRNLLVPGHFRNWSGYIRFYSSSDNLSTLFDNPILFDPYSHLQNFPGEKWLPAVTQRMKFLTFNSWEIGIHLNTTATDKLLNPTDKIIVSYLNMPEWGIRMIHLKAYGNNINNRNLQRWTSTANGHLIWRSRWMELLLVNRVSYYKLFTTILYFISGFMQTLRSKHWSARIWYTREIALIIQVEANKPPALNQHGTR